jgi:hypothetical protein
LTVKPNSIELGSANGTESHIDFHSNGLAIANFNDYDARIQCQGGGNMVTSQQGMLCYNAASHTFSGNMIFIPSGGSVPNRYATDYGMKMFYNTSNVFWNQMTEYVAYSNGGWGGHSFFYVNNNETICPNGANRIIDLGQYIRCYQNLDMNNYNITNVGSLSIGGNAVATQTWVNNKNYLNK